MTATKKLQIGVIGSCIDLRYSSELKTAAVAIGKFIAKNNAILVYGAEKDMESLPAVAALSAKRAKGLTVGVTYGIGLYVFTPAADVVIAGAWGRGGAREVSLVQSCDVVIALSGGSGTLNEITIAYQAGIPIVALEKSGGWSQKLSGKYLDPRERIKIETASTAQKAVELAIRLAQKRLDKENRAQKVLFVAATHGDETLGVSVLKKLDQVKEMRGYDWIIGNPWAFRKKRRFIEEDLNRLYPGNTNSYEGRRSQEILALTRQYRAVVDIHSTTANTGIFLLLSNPTWENLLLASLFDIERVVLWPSTSGRKTGPLTANVPIGVEIECGPKDNLSIKKRLQFILENFFQKSSGISPSEQMRRLAKKELYWVYGKYANEKEMSSLREFTLTKKEGEQFYPLLIGRYPGSVCYKMRRLGLNEIDTIFHC